MQLTQVDKAKASSPGAPRTDTRLLAHCADAAEREEFAILYRQSTRVRNALLGVLTKEIDGVTIELEEGTHLSSPNALATLTDKLAYRRGIRFAVKLLTQEKQ